MKRVLPLAIAKLCLGLSPSLAQAQVQTPAQPEARFGFNATQAMQWLPLSSDARYGIIVPVTVNGQATYANIDTGSTVSDVAVISSALLPATGGTKNAKTISANGYGGVSHYPIRRADSLVIGGITLLNQPVAVTDHPLSLDKRVGVTIGIKMLMGLTLQVDWENRRARFLLGGDLPKDADTVTVAIETRTHLPIVDAELCGIPVKALLDTGANGDVHLVPEQEGLWECAAPVRSNIRGIGAGGPVISELVSVPAVRIGKRLMGPATASIDPEGGPLSNRGIPASIGTGLLRRSNFVLDAGNSALAFYGSDRTARVTDRPRIGIQYRPDGKGLLITHIMKASPASQTILKPGDRICSLNGRTIEALAGKYGDISPPVGKIARVGVCAGPTVSILASDYLAFPGVPD
ncbi:aspartyl protease family protein, partial [Sphingomonas sp. NPDC049708]